MTAPTITTNSSPNAVDLLPQARVAYVFVMQA